MSSNSETNTPMSAVQKDRDREQVAKKPAVASVPEEKAPAAGSLAEEGAGSAKPADSAEPESIAEKPADKKKPAAPAKKPAAAKKPAVAKKAAPKPLNKTCVSDEVVVRFDHVTKTYNLFKNDRARLLGLFNIKRKGSYLGKVDASNDLSFEIKKGEAVAFLGRNGAGKSTALKMITGVTAPTSGTVTVNGRVSALLELTAGFDMKLTGRENIDLRCQIMGIDKDLAKELEPGIIDFAELGVYIDQPMRSYSSGMRARLGFAFAVATKPDILIVDEALSVGDVTFKRKCIKRIREIMMDENVTVLFVTHSNATAREFCSRGIVLDHGTKLFDGKLDEAIAFYDDMTKEGK